MRVIVQALLAVALCLPVAASAQSNKKVTFKINSIDNSLVSYYGISILRVQPLGSSTVSSVVLCQDTQRSKCSWYRYNQTAAYDARDLRAGAFFTATGSTPWAAGEFSASKIRDVKFSHSGVVTHIYDYSSWAGVIYLRVDNGNNLGKHNPYIIVVTRENNALGLPATKAIDVEDQFFGSFKVGDVVQAAVNHYWGVYESNATSIATIDVDVTELP